MAEESKTDIVFTTEQRARGKALDAARAVLVQRNALGSSEIKSVVDLITVAQYILDGSYPCSYPWQSDESDVDPSIIIRDYNGDFVMEVKDEPRTEPADEGV